MARDPAPLCRNLDRTVGDARLQPLTDEARRHRVLVIANLDVIIGCDPTLLSTRHIGISVRRGWKSFERVPIDLDD